MTKKSHSKDNTLKKVLIVGGGFAGLNAAKNLGNAKDIDVTLVDKNNYHLFQPLLYQVATAGLSPSDIAVPLRSILADYSNVRVLQGNVNSVDLKSKIASTDFGELEYDYLILSCGARHTYFGNDQWEEFAPGLKTIEQATEIRRRILTAFEKAERINDQYEQKKLLTFVVVGGGPTGVELAGAIGEMSRYTLSKDFRNINPALTRVILIEAGARILPSFSEKQSARAVRDLETLGVQVWTSSAVTNVYENGVDVGIEKIQAATVLWAAGIQGVDLNKKLGIELDRQERIIIGPDLSLKENPEVFIGGDQAACPDQTGNFLPGLAPVAMQQGIFIAKNIQREIKGKSRLEFKYHDKGQLATIGKNRAVADTGNIQIEGFAAWLAWLFIHILFIIGFNNKLFIFIKWITSYVGNGKGARLITNKKWRFYSHYDDR